MTNTGVEKFLHNKAKILPEILDYCFVLGGRSSLRHRLYVSAIGSFSYQSVFNASSYLLRRIFEEVNYFVLNNSF